MKQEIAEQLLFESEATLRLVDSLLDELREVEPNRQTGQLGMHALQLAEEHDPEELADLTDLLAAAADQARAVLTALARSRGVLEKTFLEKLPHGQEEHREAPSAVEVRGGLERALLLVDRLEAEDGSTPVQRLLREEILEMLDGVRAQEITEQQLSYASSVLRETESQLSALVQRLSPPRAEVIAFPAGRLHS
jgi:hypothetical protein